MNDELKIRYELNNSWGMSTSLDLHECNPRFIRSEEKIKEYVVQLCDLIKVKRYGECIISHFGEREDITGYSFAQMIETSLVSGHFSEKTNTAYLDIFSCQYYDPDIVAEFSKEYFEAEDFTMNYLFRK